MAFLGICFSLTLRTDSRPVKEKFKHIDVLGVVLFVGSCTSFLFGLTAGGILYSWNSAHVIVPLVIGVVGFVGFYFIEEYVSKEPMLPMVVFKERTAFAGYVGTWAHGVILWGVIYYEFLWVFCHLLCKMLISGTSSSCSLHPTVIY